MKVVFHVDELGMIREARHNIEYVLLTEPDAEIVLLMNGEAVQGYLLPRMSKFMKEYQDVTYQACHQSMRNFRVRSKQMHEQVEIIESGVIGLVKLQEQGYSYVKC
ncbi:DsrE family protein [Enterococcus xiangfangensis]|uniref:DsrE family protein n=1 Tax=Enterococcus xiangfangensis TaxID=1296537 RepID=UPI0010F455A8|nr:DsrE family protein [Enterococcus xiangfangensis]MBM7710990.1 intracellular sulfur oxidation DsrE/DsrF family protein [Enterococcus xiangfangensis]NBK07819.1 sulfur reduction protein DsrE [Enterococcus asini]